MSTNKPPKLLDDVKKVMRLKHYALSTEKNYCSWIIQFVKFHQLNSKVEFMAGGEKMY